VIGNFIAYSVIYGYAPFIDDANVKTDLKRCSYTAGRQYHTYAFGSASRFRGVISSKVGVTLIGWGWEKANGIYDLKMNPIIQYVRLARYQHQADWYNKVSIDCAAAYVVPFGAVQRYSPISSLMFMSKKAVQLALVSPAADGDIYVADVVERERHTTGTRFDVSALDVADEEEEEDFEDATDEFEDEDVVPTRRPLSLDVVVPDKRKKVREVEIYSDNDELEEIMPVKAVVAKKKKKEDRPPPVVSGVLSMPPSAAFVIPDEESDLVPDKEDNGSVTAPDPGDI